MPSNIPASVQIGESVLFQAIQDEAVLLDMEKQHYYGLDPVAADMWKSLIEEGNLEAVTQRMVAKYDTDAATVRSDLESLVAKLLEAGLMKPAVQS